MVGTDANGEGQIIKNVAISASEKIFRVMDIKNLAWNSTDSYDPTISETINDAYDKKNNLLPLISETITTVSNLPVSDGH